jgi:hypothetical protein
MLVPDKGEGIKYTFHPDKLTISSKRIERGSTECDILIFNSTFPDGFVVGFNRSFIKQFCDLKKRLDTVIMSITSDGRKRALLQFATEPYDVKYIVMPMDIHGETDTETPEEKPKVNTSDSGNVEVSLEHIEQVSGPISQNNDSEIEQEKSKVELASSERITITEADIEKAHCVNNDTGISDDVIEDHPELANSDVEIPEENEVLTEAERTEIDDAADKAIPIDANQCPYCDSYDWALKDEACEDDYLGITKRCNTCGRDCTVEFKAVRIIDLEGNQLKP